MEKVKKIVLIGASGFVGSALLNEALNRGFEVTAVVRHPADSLSRNADSLSLNFSIQR